MFQDRREFSGSLLQQMNDTFDFLTRYNRIRAEVVGPHRVDSRDYPEEALREALLNALVHRDYGFSASTLISVFDDRIEFVSVGGLGHGISLDDILLGVSMPRNEGLAGIFYRLPLIEAYGTGIPKILRSYRGRPSQPVLESSDNAFKITLPNCNAAPGAEQSQEPASGLEQAAIELLNQFGRLTCRDLEKELGLKQTVSIKLLNKLIEKNLIRREGKGRNTEFFPISE